jgi:hypothetical protein
MHLMGPVVPPAAAHIAVPALLILVLVVSAVALVTARSHPSTLPGLLLIYGTLLTSTAFAMIVRYPDRAKAPLTVPLAWGALLLTHAVTSRLPRAIRWGTASIVVLVGLAALPAMASRTHLDRSATRTIGFLETYAKPDERAVLICNKSQPLQLGLEAGFRDDWIAQGELDLDLIFKGEEHGTELMKRAWLRRLRDFLLPPVQRTQTSASSIEMLVYVVDEKIGRDPSQWEHEALTAMRRRLTHREEFQQGFYRIVVFTEPGAGA